MSDSGVDAAF